MKRYKIAFGNLIGKVPTQLRLNMEPAMGNAIGSRGEGSVQPVSERHMDGSRGCRFGEILIQLREGRRPVPAPNFVGQYYILSVLCDGGVELGMPLVSAA